MVMLGEELVLEEAPEPSNLIWENQSIDDLQMLKNQVIIITFVVCFLALVHWLFSYLKQQATRSLATYPVGMNCNSIRKLFEDRDSYKRYAEFDREPTLLGKGTGVY